jgi:hypothetical protein
MLSLVRISIIILILLSNFPIDAYSQFFRPTPPPSESNNPERKFKRILFELDQRIIPSLHHEIAALEKETKKFNFIADSNKLKLPDTKKLDNILARWDTTSKYEITVDDGKTLKTIINNIETLNGNNDQGLILLNNCRNRLKIIFRLKLAAETFLMQIKSMEKLHHNNRHRNILNKIKHKIQTEIIDPANITLAKDYSWYSQSYLRWHYKAQRIVSLINMIAVLSDQIEPFNLKFPTLNLFEDENLSDEPI